MKEEIKGYMMREMPEEDRPREKLERYGVESLSNAELLGILLGTGSRDKNAVELADELLKHIQREGGAVNVDIEDLMCVKGVGKAKACTVIAAVEFGKRIMGKDNEPRGVMNSPDIIYNYMRTKVQSAQRESFYCLLLDVKCKLIYDFEVSQGGAEFATADPRAVFEKAVRRQATSIVLVHNHPSGDPSPSKADIQLTERLSKAGDILEIKVVDHIIVGNGTYFSFSREGYL